MATARQRVAGERLWIGLSAIVLLLVLWQWLGGHLGAGARFVGTPLSVAAAGRRLIAEGELASNIEPTAVETGVGMAAALVLGIPFGVALGRFRRIRLTFEPLVIALYSTPLLAVVPVLQAWLGVGVQANAAVAFLMAVIPLMLNTAVGVREVENSWILAVRSFGGTERDVFFKVILPGALPAEMTGVRLAIGRAILGAIVGEMYAAAAGLGQLVMLYGQSDQASPLIFVIAVIAVSGYVVTMLARRVEERAGRWRLGQGG